MGPTVADTTFEWLAKINSVIVPIAVTALIAWGAWINTAVHENQTVSRLNAAAIGTLVKTTDKIADAVDDHVRLDSHAVTRQRLTSIDATLTRIERTLSTINKRMP